MNEVELTKSCEIKPEILSKDKLKPYLINKLKEAIKDECTEDNGHVLYITNKNVEIVDHNISRLNNRLICIVKFTACVFKPVKSLSVFGTVVMILEDGIFITIFDKQKLLIPSIFLPEKFKFIDNSFISDDNCIKVDDKLKVEITNVEYSNNEFNCLGKIIF